MESYDEIRETLIKLESNKQQVVEEAEALLESLNSIRGVDGAPIGLHGKLVDEYGFPRNDVDLYQIRSIRNRLACLRTDRKQLEQDIERRLHQLHQIIEAEHDSEKADAPSLLPSGAVDAALSSQDKIAKLTENLSSRKEETLAPFAKVDMVFPGSRAERASLKVGDQIIRFGSIKYSLTGSDVKKPLLSDIATEAKKIDGKSIQIRVIRGIEEHELTIAAQDEAEEASLGFHLLAC